jgi:hypothetical protein
MFTNDMSQPYVLQMIYNYRCSVTGEEINFKKQLFQIPFMHACFKGDQLYIMAIIQPVICWNFWQDFKPPAGGLHALNPE